jgi:hypothetical protein
MITHLIVTHAAAAEHAHHVPEILAQCRTRYWKHAVRFFQEQLGQAQKNNDMVRVNELMQKFDNLKKSMHGKGVL